MKPKIAKVFDRALSSLQDFLRLSASGGIVLMAVTILAMIVANSPLAPSYERFLALPFSITLGGVGLAKPLILWINDGLMAVFFLLVGMELKREIVEGHLSSLRKATLPAIAAVGGMAAPAAIYFALNRHDPVALAGWAIPAATDIAFALGVVALLGSRVPPALKAFLLSVAIFDDLGAIVVIALFYTSKLSFVALAVAGACVLGLFILNQSGVKRPAAYILLGIPLWIAVLKSGVHATLAGVVLAMFLPLGKRDAEYSPLRDLEHALHPWVAFGVLPIFAFANAGVSLSGLSLSDLLHPVPLGIAGGLFVGKQVGIFASGFLAVKTGLAALPEGVRWGQLYAAAILCGIGFTMSLFIASLAFEDAGGAFSGLDRLGILLGSLVAGIGGYAALRATSK